MYIETQQMIVRDFTPTNAAKSVGLMKKLGMRLEGSQTIDNQGNWADLYFCGLPEEEWREKWQFKESPNPT